MDRQPFHVLLGVTGSVSCYRAADLARTLMRSGAEVRVCLTAGALHFVSAQLFEALTGYPVLVDTFDEPVPGRMAHIDLARWADVILIAPATANTLAKIAHGIADNMLTTIASASMAPTVAAPAMNPQMFASDAMREALDTLIRRGVTIVEPLEGDVACGEHGQGKLADIAVIAEETFSALSEGQLLHGRKVLITSGPTQEPIDSVRFLSNRSSGKMGSAIARSALSMGAEVVVIAGASKTIYPLGAKVVPVRTAQEMLQAALSEGAGADLIIGAAAVADYRVTHPSTTKIRRSDQPICLHLEPNPDIIATLAKSFPAAIVVGFAAEPSVDIEVAQNKMRRKGLRAIAINDISDPAIGFDSDENELTLAVADGSVTHSGKVSKSRCARWLLTEISSFLSEHSVPQLDIASKLLPNVKGLGPKAHSIFCKGSNWKLPLPRPWAGPKAIPFSAKRLVRRSLAKEEASRKRNLKNLRLVRRSPAKAGPSEANAESLVRSLPTHNLNIAALL